MWPKWSHDHCYGERRSKMAVCWFRGAGRNYSPGSRYSFRRFVKVLSKRVILSRLHVKLFNLAKTKLRSTRERDYSPLIFYSHMSTAFIGIIISNSSVEATLWSFSRIQICLRLSLEMNFVLNFA